LKKWHKTLKIYFPNAFSRVPVYCLALSEQFLHAVSRLSLAYVDDIIWRAQRLACVCVCVYDEVARPRRTQSPEADVTGRRIWTEDGNEPSRHYT